MTEPRNTSGVGTSKDNRREPRHPFDAAVTVEVDAAQLVGSGENISSQGVFFTVAERLSVTVRIDGRTDGIRGELVRVESMGGGKVGIAVRFLEPLPDTGR